MKNKIWHVIRHEYVRHVFRKRFIFALLSIPLWILITIAAGALSIFLTLDSRPVGYLDQAGVLADIDVAGIAQSSDSFTGVKFFPYQNEDEAKTALQDKKIQAYFLISTDFEKNIETKMIYLENPSSTVKSQFADLIQAALLQEIDPDISYRILEGPDLVIEARQEESNTAKNEWFKIAAPLVAGFFLMISVFTSAGYLMQAVVEEKENRTMELLATSHSPTQIMGGKVITLISVGLTQVIIWSLFPLIMVALARDYVPFLRDIMIDWKMIGLVFLLAIPTFVLISTLMATLGATITEAQEGNQVSTLITLPVMAPYLLFSALMANPGGAIAVGLSLFPLSAALTLLIRIAFASVPEWQIGLSVAILIGTTIGAIWLSGRVFRFGMLRYGKKMSLKEVIQAVTFKDTPSR